MKATSSLLASVLFLTACGNVVTDSDPGDGDPVGDHDFGKVDGFELGDGDGSGSGSGSDMMPPPPPELPFLTEAPHAATTPGSLFSVTFANSEVRNVVGSTSSEARYDILEQRIVTKVAEPISVTIGVTAPAGTFSRTIATDTTRYGTTVVGPTVLCRDSVTDYFLPECNTAPPAKSTTPASGAITRGRWKLSLVNEATNAKVNGCIANGTYEMTCALPAGAGVAYKVMLSADGFADLWNDTPLAESILDGNRFSGVIQPLEFQCDPSLYEVEGLREYCYGHWVYNRYTGIDAASLSFEPMTVTITAGGATKQLASAAMTWDAGNDDLPGANY